MFLLAAYRRVRRSVTGSLEAVGRACDDLTLKAHGWPQDGRSRLARRWLQRLGAAAHFLNLLPRVDAHRLSGDRWTTIYVGDPAMLPEIQHLLYPEGARVEKIERVWTHRLRSTVTAQLREVDLVVCGLSRAWPTALRPEARWTFTCSTFVNTSINLADRFGGADHRRRHRLRWEANRFRRLGLTTVATRNRESHLHFFNDLYLPHVIGRHGNRAMVTTASDQWRHWIADRGELLLLMKNNTPVAGVTMRFEGQTCFLGEEGIAPAEASPPLQSAIKVAALEHAKMRGASIAVMGRSPARLSDRGLLSKLRWGGKLFESERSQSPDWTFLMDSPPHELLAHLDKAALLAVNNGSARVLALALPARFRTVGRLGAEAREFDVRLVEPDMVHSGSRIARPQK